MGVSNSDISWWALPDHVFLGSFTSAHPVAAIWYDAIILSFTWPMAGRATWQQAVLFIFPCPRAVWIYSGLDGFLVILIGILKCRFMLSGCPGGRWPWPRALIRSPIPIVKLRLRWPRWSRDQTCGFPLESAQLHQGLDDLGLFLAFISLLNDMGGMNMAVWMWWFIGCRCQVHSWKHQKRNKTVLCMAAVHFSWSN